MSSILDFFFFWGGIRVDQSKGDSLALAEVYTLLTTEQEWAQGSFVKAEAEVEAERSRPRRGRLNSRQGRGEATP